MRIDVMERGGVAGGPADCGTYADPLDPDLATDAPIVVTMRALVRLALASAETAARFEREGVVADPVAWMLAPRRLFEGRAAVEACLEREGCLRAVLLHGLSLGMDADPDALDELADDGTDRAGDAGRDGWECVGVCDAEAGPPRSRPSSSGPGPRLWTSFAVERRGGSMMQAFDAVVARGREEAEARVRARRGPDGAGAIEIVEGFDPSLPLVGALVSDALADMLEQVAGDPGSPLAEGLSVSVRQRFAA